MAADENATGPSPISEGEFAGWLSWGERDSFEQAAGPFYERREADGGVRCAFRAEARHMNAGGAMHGGCMMTFADHALFAVSRPARGDAVGVTVSLTGDFLGPAFPGDLIEATGEVTRQGKSLTFVRGLATAAGRPMLSFSGLIKQVRRGGLDAQR